MPTFDEFPLGGGISLGPFGIAAGSDGNLWFTESDTSNIGGISPMGAVDDFPLSDASSGPLGIAAGPDGNLWFTEMAKNQIGRITPQGIIAEFVIPTAGSGAARIAAGPDGNLWFTESAAIQIGRITVLATARVASAKGVELQATARRNYRSGSAAGQRPTLRADCDIHRDTGAATYLSTSVLTRTYRNGRSTRTTRGTARSTGRGKSVSLDQ
jgi:hypothetical protein